VKSDRMMTLTFGLAVTVSGRSRRVRQIREVIKSLERA